MMGRSERPGEEDMTRRPNKAAVASRSETDAKDLNMPR